MTNREWLNSLSNEEYASFQSNIIWCDICCNTDETHAQNCAHNCAQVLIVWLSQEHDASFKRPTQIKDEIEKKAYLFDLIEQHCYVHKGTIPDDPADEALLNNYFNGII